MRLKQGSWLLTAAMSAVYANIGWAETVNPADETKLKAVVISATKTEKSVDKVTASVQVIGEEDIQKMGAITLKDIFQNTPGLVLQYGTFPSGSSASKSSVNIRGLGTTGTLWLLDGRRLAGEVSNPYDMDRFPASMIERIEIVKGPMSALYGADAVGGVINIITKQPQDKFVADVSVTGGANGEGEGSNKQISANVRGGTGGFRGKAFVSVTESGAYYEQERTNTTVTPNQIKPSQVKSPPMPAGLKNIQDSYDVGVSYRENATVKTIGGRGEYDVTDQLTLGVEGYWMDEERHGSYRGTFHPTGYKMQNPQGQMSPVPAYDVPINSKDENERYDVAMDAQYFVNDDLDLDFRVYRSYYTKRNTTTVKHHQDFGYPSESASESNGMNANVDVTSYELSANWAPVDNHLLTGGVEYREEKREATVFSQSSDMDTRKVSSQAIYLQDDFTLGDTWSLTLGGRYDQYDQGAYTDQYGIRHDSQSDSETTFRAGVLKNIHPLLNVRFNAAQGFRVPDLRELFIQKQTPGGQLLGAQTIDPQQGKQAYDLKPEKTMSYELGLSGETGRFSYSLAGFYNQIHDKIQQVSVAGNATDYYTFQNVKDAETKGMELTLGYQFLRNLQGKLFWTELRTEDKDTGKQLEFNPDRVVEAALDWDITSRFRLGTYVVYTGEQYYVEDTQGKYTDPYTLTNLTTGYRFGEHKQIDLYGGINNVFDQKVDTEIGSNVGAYYFAGVRVEF
ncbi:MAG: TonB-dependent receptor plug domain-containing protein [Hydrogenovibrio sp.]